MHAWKTSVNNLMIFGEQRISLGRRLFPHTKVADGHFFFRTGFTLIEMLVVVSILGILLSIAGRNNSVVLERSRDAALMTEMRHIRNAVAQYQLDHGGTLPNRLSALAGGPLKRVPETWVGSRGRGRYHLDPETGSIALYRNDETGPETSLDSHGRAYAEY
ncbi:MAG: type II secretion system protein [Candidatus Ozemobacteraceae bacterium]